MERIDWDFHMVKGQLNESNANRHTAQDFQMGFHAL